MPKLFRWLTTEFIGKNTKKPYSESSALTVITAVRSFFAYHRYTLEIRKEALPSSEKVTGVYEDHAFDTYQLRSMFNQGDLKERTILACGKDLFLRVGDFANLSRDFIELTIKREEEKAENENRPLDIVQFELTTEKEKEPCSSHLSRETIELLKDYLKSYPKTDRLFPLTDDALTDVLRRLAEKAKITVTGRICWHCLRKFSITVMHDQIEESVMKYMTGKHISKDLKTYIQKNNADYKAFKKIEPQISLTKQNGNGKANKELEELRKENSELKRMFKLLAEAQSEEVTKNLFAKLKAEGYHEGFIFGEGGAQKPYTTVEINGEKNSN